MTGRVIALGAIIVLGALMPSIAYSGIIRLTPAMAVTDSATNMVNVGVEIDGAADISIYNLGITYEASLLDAVAVAGPDINPTDCIFETNDQSDGSICILITCVPPIAINTAVIATLQFTGNMAGLSSLAFSDSACPEPEAPTGCYLADVNAQPQSCGAFGGSVLVVPTITPTPTISPTASASSTPTASATPTAPAVVDLNPVVTGALPGGMACIGSNLAGGIGSVASTRHLIDFGVESPFALADCTIAPDIDSNSSFAKQLSTSAPSPGVAQIDVGGSPTSLPPGGLFSCRIAVSPAATPGSYPIGNTASAFDSSGDPLPAVQGSGSTIKVTSCVGDCNGNAIVSIGEVQRCVSHFLGLSLCSSATVSAACPAADASHNGVVSIGEVQQCVSRFLGGC